MPRCRASARTDARQLANRGNYDLNPAETAVLINWSNDLFYYEFGSDRAVRLTSNPEEEVGESFSPDGRMVGFVRENKCTSKTSACSDASAH